MTATNSVRPACPVQEEPGRNSRIDALSRCAACWTPARSTLKSGKYYELEITADGSQELAIGRRGASFRAIWVDEVVIEGIEVRPLRHLDSLEFDEAGAAEISFVAVKPGIYWLGVPGSELQRVEITIK